MLLIACIIVTKLMNSTVISDDYKLVHGAWVKLKFICD